MRGLHLTADLFDCRDSQGLLLDSVRASAFAARCVDAVGLTTVARSFHAFPDGPHTGGGWTGVLLLAESHVALHTWPEARAVTIDVFVCNVGVDNSAKARALLHALEQAFEPGHAQGQQLVRGDAATAPPPMP